MPPLYLQPGKLVEALKLQPGMRVGDFGVGGAAAFAVPIGRAVGTDGEVFLFDVLKSALSSATSMMKLNGLSNAKIVWSNLELFEGARGVGNNTLDAGVLVNVLHESKHGKPMLAEIHRMLKPGAKLLVVDWQPDVRASFAPEKRERLAAEHVSSLARGLGFAEAQKLPAGAYHWALILVKT